MAHLFFFHKFLKLLKLFKGPLHLLLVGLLIVNPLYPLFRGKNVPPPNDASIWISLNNKASRSISFFAFENLSKDPAFASLQTSVPTTIAQSLQKVKTLRLPPEDYIPVMQNTDKYQIFEYPFDDIDDTFSYERFLENRLDAFTASDAATALWSEEPSPDLTDLGALQGGDGEPPLESLGEQAAALIEKLADDKKLGSSLPQDASNALPVQREGEGELSWQSLGEQASALIKKLAEDKLGAVPAPLEDALQQAEQIIADGSIPENLKNIIPLLDEVGLNSFNKQADPSLVPDVTEETNLSAMEQFKVNVLSPRFAYLIKQEPAQKYLIYHFTTKASQYIDAQLIPEEQRQDLDTLITKQGGIAYFTIDTYPEKTLIVENDLYFLNGTPLLEAIKQVKTDYILYGTYETKGASFTLSLFLIYTHEKKIAHIYSKSIRAFRLDRLLAEVAVTIRAYLEKREIVSNIRLTTEEENVLLRLDGRIIGKLPLTLSHLVKGAYRYEVSKRGYYNSAVTSRLPLDGEKFIANDSDQEIAFELTKKDDVGEILMQVDNDVPINFYIDTELMAVKQTSFLQTDLPPNYYYVLVDDGEMYKRNFQIEVLPNMRTKINFSINDATRPRHKDMPYTGFNYNVTARLSAVVGLTALTGFFAHRIRTLKIEDDIEGVRLALSRLNSAGDNSADLVSYQDDLENDFNASQTIDLVLLISSLTSLITMMVMHSFDVWKDRVPIESSFSANGDVSISYVKKLGPRPEKK